MCYFLDDGQNIGLCVIIINTFHLQATALFYLLKHTIHPLQQQSCSSKKNNLSMNDENFIKRCVCTRCRVPKNLSLFLIILQIFPFMCKNCKKRSKRCQKDEKSIFFAPNRMWMKETLQICLNWRIIKNHLMSN